MFSETEYVLDYTPIEPKTQEFTFPPDIDEAEDLNNPFEKLVRVNVFVNNITLESR